MKAFILLSLLSSLALSDDYSNLYQCFQAITPVMKEVDDIEYAKGATDPFLVSDFISNETCVEDIVVDSDKRFNFKVDDYSRLANKAKQFDKCSESNETVSVSEVKDFLCDMGDTASMSPQNRLRFREIDVAYNYLDDDYTHRTGVDFVTFTYELIGEGIFKSYMSPDELPRKGSKVYFTIDSSHGDIQISYDESKIEFESSTMHQGFAVHLIPEITILNSGSVFPKIEKRKVDKTFLGDGINERLRGITKSFGNVFKRNITKYYGAVINSDVDTANQIKKSIVNHSSCKILKALYSNETCNGAYLYSNKNILEEHIDFYKQDYYKEHEKHLPEALLFCIDG